MMRSVAFLSILANAEISKISIEDIIEADALEHMLDMLIVRIVNNMVAKRKSWYVIIIISQSHEIHIAAPALYDTALK